MESKYSDLIENNKIESDEDQGLFTTIGNQTKNGKLIYCFFSQNSKHKN
jgi:hypothetical protein